MTKALYLDCDTIVCSSIEKMYETPLGDCLAGMIMEPTVYKEMKESIDMDKDDAYFNSGVILMDLAGWRRENVLKKLLDFYGDHAGSLFACDQDTINGALNGRILPLSPRYNFFTNYRYFRYNTLVQLCDAYRAVGKKSLLQLREDQRSFIFWEMSGPGSVATTIIMENGIGNIWL